MSQFIADHPDWPGNDWLRKRIEDALYSDKLLADEGESLVRGEGRR